MAVGLAGDHSFSANVISNHLATLQAYSFLQRSGFKQQEAFRFLESNLQLTILCPSL